jgi:putative heme-binding domain-containing protein
LSFRQKSDSAELERLAQAALGRQGDVENGRMLFFDAAKTQCIKCHRIGERGERIGPDLTGVGGRFARAHLVDSILQPSRSIANNYQTLAVELADGTALAGIVVAQDDESLTLADNKGEKHRVQRREIAAQAYQPLSTMPAGLEKQLSEQEFVDLVTFLTGEKTR